jgi:hypothetical protein
MSAGPTNSGDMVLCCHGRSGTSHMCVHADRLNSHTKLWGWSQVIRCPGLAERRHRRRGRAP